MDAIFPKSNRNVNLSLRRLSENFFFVQKTCFIRHEFYIKVGIFDNASVSDQNIDTFRKKSNFCINN